ncbi:MAG TPA: c-type cytochrome domain-containing protein, partial [Vicinamibacterales bacterium]
MIGRPSLARVGVFALAAAPLIFQIVAEARQTAPPATAAATAEYFEANVRPLLAANCYDCHTDQRMGGLRLDSREALLKGGRSGAAIVPGDPDKSLLIVAVRLTRDNLKMPKGGQLKPAEIDALAEWVRAGAPWFSAATITA